MTTQENVYIKVSTPIDAPGAVFALDHIEGREDISEPFSYRLALTRTDEIIDFSDLIGQAITVSFAIKEGAFRYINGIVTRFAQGESDDMTVPFEAEIRPWFWLLTMTRDSKIFQEKTIPDIIEEVFGELGYTDYRLNLTATYEPRIYCVQYQESAYNFVSRLMEEMGIYYYFEHIDGVHTMVLADAASSLEPCTHSAIGEIAATAAQWQYEEFVTNASYVKRVIPNKFSLCDYNFETPDTSLLVNQTGEGADLELYEYPGKYETASVGESLATLRIESVERPETSIKGEGTCKGFTAGNTFSLTKHTRPELNVDYVIESLYIRADQDRFTNTFEAFPADVEIRPRRKTPRPRIYGSQHALVVGKEGEEIWCDDYGRIKVQFYWDRIGENNEDSSCWVRVAQMWAGKKWGTLFTPRMGTEVIISFLEGDPDRPIVVGTVYNANQVVPYPLPDDKIKSTFLTRSTKEGEFGNELRFDDTIDEEELYMHAQKDMNTKVENDYNLRVDGNLTIEAIGDIRIKGKSIGSQAVGGFIANKAKEGIFNVGMTGIHNLSLGPITNTSSIAITSNVSHLAAAIVAAAKIVEAKTGEVVPNWVSKIENIISAAAGIGINNISTKTIANIAWLGILNEAGLGMINLAGGGIVNACKGEILNTAGLGIMNTAGLDIVNKAKGAIMNGAGLAIVNLAGKDMKNKATLGIINTASLAIVNNASTDIKSEASLALLNKAGLGVINQGTTVENKGSVAVIAQGAIVKLG